MAGPEESDPGASHSFGLEIDGVLVAMVSEVLGLRLQREVIELKETGADGTTHVRRLPGHPTPGEIVLTRALTGDSTFETWVVAASFGGAVGAPSSVAIVLLDSGGLGVRRYTLVDAWPVKLEIAGASAEGSLVERLVISYTATEPG